jgi:hypothetical protein
MSQVGNDGEGGGCTIDSTVKLDSSSIVNQHVFTMQLAMFLGYYAMSGTNFKKNQKFKNSKTRSIVDHYPLFYRPL